MPKGTRIVNPGVGKSTWLERDDTLTITISGTEAKHGSSVWLLGKNRPYRPAVVVREVRRHRHNLFRT